jgi:YggT family protein
MSGMTDPYYPIFWAIDQVLTLFLIVLFVRIILSWLFAFQVINPRHPLAWQVNHFATRITEPVMRPIQRALPPMGGIDLSPFVILIVIYVLQMYLWQLYVAIR